MSTSLTVFSIIRGGCTIIKAVARRRIMMSGQEKFQIEA